MKKHCIKQYVGNFLRSSDKLRSKSIKSSSIRVISLLLALSLLLFLVAFPSSNYNSLVDISNQRNSLDSALKQIVSGKQSWTRSQAEIPASVKQRLASLEKEEANPISNMPNSGISYDGITATFPYVYPVMGPRKSSGFGLRLHPIRGFSSNHKGIDLAAPVGASIRAMSEGRVIFADPYAGYGNLVVIDHGNGITTHYAHCYRLKVHTGQKVETGQMIAEVGSTGMSTGPHLHLEVRVKGQPLNPEGFFVGLADKAEG